MAKSVNINVDVVNIQVYELIEILYEYMVKAKTTHPEMTQTWDDAVDLVKYIKDGMEESLNKHV